MPSLFVIQGRDQGKRYELQDPCVRIGRDSSNTIHLHDTEVSRQHAEVRHTDGQYELIDLDSSNGSFINSSRIRSQLLTSGDRVQLGRSLMIYTAGDEQASADLAEGVDIVGYDQLADGSRIIKSIAQPHRNRSQADQPDTGRPWLAHARSNLDVMYHTALATSHTMDIDQLLQRIMELIFEWVEADRGCVMLVDSETGELSPAVRRDRHQQHAGERMEISRTILDYVMTHNEGVQTSDAREDERWGAAGSIVRMGVREAICVPMQGRYDVVGVIYIDTFTAPGRYVQERVNRFSEDHLKLMIAIGHQAALAVEDTAYYSAMVQAERLAAIGQTIATLSHHIKNILQGIRGGSYLIEEGLKGSEHDLVAKGWKIVEKNQDKISNLVMDMLSFSKERKPEMVPSQLNEVAQDVVELMEKRAADAQVALRFTPQASMPDLMYDPDAMHRAILNVVTNAIDACEATDNAQVTIRTEFVPDQQVARILIQDNGPGISADDVAKIFSLFESRKGNRGTGLGLPVSQKILQEHDGQIHVESQPEQGSCFCLELPAVMPSSNGPPTTDGPPP